LALGVFAWRTCGGIIRQTRDLQDMVWMRNLAAMLQVSLLGYATSGAFLGLSYFDYYYALLAIIVGMDAVLKCRLTPADAQTAHPAPLPASRSAGLQSADQPSATSLYRIFAFARRWYGRL
jgi:hypothetical protein